MKCPMCGGIGLTDLHTPNVGRCIKCNGSGEIEPTNEEWLRSLNTEQLAEWMYKQNVYAFFVCRNGGKVPSKEHYIEWLKEKHE